MELFTTSHNFQRLAKEKFSIINPDSDLKEKNERLEIFNVSNLNSPDWSLNTWLNPKITSFGSISEAVKILCSIQRNWCLYPNDNFRRASLIQESLPSIKSKEITFPSTLPGSPLGTWSLLEKNKIVYSSACSAKVPHGLYHFIENQEGPPSRAYLKLWEFFTRFSIIPIPDSICLDLGASPGGWTWVLSNLCKEILAIDKSPLGDELMHHRKIRFQKGDILKLDLKHLSHSFNWIFCDAALHPEKIIPIFESIISENKNISMVCTIKFAGHDRYHWIDYLEKIQGTAICHLSHNKHEITWYRIVQGTYQNLA